ncbi:unnamed protein product [Rotaria sp. Silwood1]|nr:unnamed protein product [Rotaria sp. Silwood1]
MVWVGQEQTQLRSTRPSRITSVTNDNILIKVKQEYVNCLLDLSGYQKRLRPIIYPCIHLFDIADKDFLDYEPKNS